MNKAQVAFAESRGLLVADPFPDGHAELTGVVTAANRGLLPTRGVVTSPMCNTGVDNCVEVIIDMLDGSKYQLIITNGRRCFEFKEIAE